LRFTITQVELFFKDDEGSVYFDKDETVVTEYEIRYGRLVMELLGEFREFRRAAD
jgi:hypothetical protein